MSDIRRFFSVKPPSNHGTAGAEKKPDRSSCIAPASEQKRKRVIVDDSPDESIFFFFFDDAYSLGVAYDACMLRQKRKFVMKST
jgi:hypothetical protein